MSTILEQCSAFQREQFEELKLLLVEENSRKNLVSANSLQNFETRHLHHCLALTAKAFPQNARVVDWGTGGGFPLLPLAIMFPQVRFVGIDSVGRKIEAVRRMAAALGLKNVQAKHSRAEDVDLVTDYSVSRATAPLIKLWTWHKRVSFPAIAVHESMWESGLICLKGGDLSGEVAELRESYQYLRVVITPLVDIDPDLFSGEEFDGKSIVEVIE